MAEVVFFKIAVPALGGIRVGEMPQVIRRTISAMSIRRGMGMYGGAIAGNGKVFLRYEAIPWKA